MLGRCSPTVSACCSSIVYTLLKLSHAYFKLSTATVAQTDTYNYINCYTTINMLLAFHLKPAKLWSDINNSQEPDSALYYTSSISGLLTLVSVTAELIIIFTLKIDIENVMM